MISEQGLEHDGREKNERKPESLDIVTSLMELLSLIIIVSTSLAHSKFMLHNKLNIEKPVNLY